MADWHPLGFFLYRDTPDGTVSHIGDDAPHFKPGPYDRWETEPAGTLGEDICLLARCSGTGGGSSRGYKWPERGYCHAQSLGWYGAGLYGFVAGAGLWEVPVTAMGYVDSFQILTVRSEEMHLAADHLECAVPRAWVRHNGSLSYVALALEAETHPYSHRVAARIIESMGRVVMDLDARVPGHEIANILRAEIAAYRLRSVRGAA